MSAPLQDAVNACRVLVRALRDDAQAPTLVLDAENPLKGLADELAELSHTLEQRERRLLDLFDAVAEMGHGVHLEGVLEHVYTGFTGVIPFDRIGCAFLTRNGRAVQAFWAKSTLGETHLGTGYAQPMAGSSLEAVLQTRQPRILNDLVAYLADHPQSDSTRRIVAEGGRSSLTCPLVVGDVPLGFLFFTSAHPHAYTSGHQSLFRQIASQVSVVLQKSQAYDRLKHQNEVLIRETERLEVVATTDPLTGVLNRRAMDAVLARVEHPFAVIAMDVDHFKRVNDTHGHAIGDRVLQRVAHLAQEACRKQDAFGRVGGEEFLLVARTCDTAAAAVALAERVRTAVLTEPLVSSPAVLVTVSLGVALGGPAEPATDTVARADRALYEAKHTGRNRVVCAADTAHTSLAIR